MGKSQHILTGGDDKKAARAHAPMKQRDVKARPDQPAERTPPHGRDTGSAEQGDGRLRQAQGGCGCLQSEQAGVGGGRSQMRLFKQR